MGLICPSRHQARQRHGPSRRISGGPRFRVELQCESDPKEDLTSSGQQLGNRFLALPELRTPGGRKARDPRSDLSGCCGLLLFAITGEVTWMLSDEGELKPHQRPKERQTIDKLEEESRRLLDRVFDAGSQRSLTRRWQSAATLGKALHGTEWNDDDDVRAGYRGIDVAIAESSDFRRYRESPPLLQDVTARVDSAAAGVAEALSATFTLNRKRTYNTKDLEGRVQVSISSGSPPRACVDCSEPP